VVKTQKNASIELFCCVFVGSSSDCTTMLMEEHNVLRSMQSGFCVYDSRGFGYNQMGENLEELSSWMTDGIHHNQPCLRSGDDALTKDDIENLTLNSSSKFVKRRVNCAMVVVNIAEIYKASKAGDFKPLEAIRELFCCPVLRKSSKPFYNLKAVYLITFV
jgi:hypothetical protein